MQSQPARPVTRVTVTDPQRVSRNAVAAATRARPGGHVRRPQTAGSSALHPGTGVALTAVGLVLLLGVHWQLASVDVTMAGLVLAGVGVAWLWTPVRGKRALVEEQLRRALRYLSWDGAEPTDRCELTDLFGTTGDSVEPRPGDTARRH